jgi:HAL2 family 3'(2'),5'-bisphosphate nucleotidase
VIYVVAYFKELSLAVDLVKEASKITEWFRTKNTSSFIKKDDSPVTLADFASQIFIISNIKKYFPEDQIIAEEESSVFIDLYAENIVKKCYNSLNITFEENLKETLNYRGSNSKRQWTVDPIDGTKGFQKGLAYAIGMGFMIQAEPTVCAIGVPNYKNTRLTIFSAEKNHGAKVSYGDQNFTKISVSSKNEIKKFRICHSLHYNKPWVLDFARSLGITNFIPLDSMAKLCMVADGSSEIYIKPMNMQRSYTWDFLPGELLVKEAGGVITDIRGNPIQYVNDKCKITAPGLIASNGIRHEELLNLLKLNEILKNSKTV